MQRPDFSKLVLSFPELADQVDLADVTGGHRSWIQIARTGEFVSSRYGKFAITREDLAKMLHNFTHICPKSPTKLPIDYDHLSMAPKKPGDGVAAGWMGRLELREDGNELWAEVEWTPTAADRIRNKEYQFVSPSFVKDYTYKDGNKIGPTLLAAAITNHPFLEGMQALTLADDQTQARLLELSHNGILDIATRAAAAGDTMHLMERGQMVAIGEQFLRSPDQAGQVFEVVDVVGSGDDAFVALKSTDGTVLQWFRATELEPAPANPEAPPADPDAPAPPAVPLSDAAAAPPAAPAADPAAPPPAEESQPRYGRRSTDQPMRSMHMADVLKLKDTEGKEVVVSLAAIQEVYKPEPPAAPAIPEGSIVVDKATLDALQKDLAETKSQVTSLSSQNEAMATAAATERKNAQLARLNSRLLQLSKEGKITKAEADWAKSFFGADEAESVNLDGFEKWAGTKTETVVQLNREHGAGTDTPHQREAAMNLMAQAEGIVADHRQKGEVISMRDAIKEAARRNASLSEQYREEYALD